MFIFAGATTMHWIILGAAIIGLSLGLLGSGGSILTVPILTYLLGMPEKTAVASSLAIVGGISLIGALPLLRRGLVDGRALLAFGPPSMLGTVAGAWLAQRLPEGSQLLIFAPVMLVAAWRMASGGAASVQGPRKSAWAIALAGIGVGLLTGLVGIGGGFLIVPALVLLLGLPMPRAVATSLDTVAERIGRLYGLNTLGAGLGALLGGVYLGIIFNSGCGVIDSYIDKISRRYHFEYGRVRMWGSLGWAAAAWIVGKYIDSNPNLAFWLASIAIVIAAICFMLTKIELTEAEMEKTSALKVSHALELAKNGQFWMLLICTLFVTQIYDTYDQQFAQYFSLQFPTPEEGTRWYGILASIQVCGETLFLCLMPWFVNRTGAKWALIIAGLIMSVRIVGSAIPLGPVWIGAVKMMHALEKPLILVSVFKFIAANFDHKLSSTVYLLVLFVASIATAIYSPLAGYLYDTIGFAHTYYILGSIAGLFTLISIFTLRDKREPTAPGSAPAGGVAQP